MSAYLLIYWAMLLFPTFLLSPLPNMLFSHKEVCVCVAVNWVWFQKMERFFYSTKFAPPFLKLITSHFHKGTKFFSFHNEKECQKLKHLLSSHWYVSTELQVRCFPEKKIFLKRAKWEQWEYRVLKGEEWKKEQLRRKAARLQVWRAGDWRRAAGLVCGLFGLEEPSAGFWPMTHQGQQVLRGISRRGMGCPRHPSDYWHLFLKQVEIRPSYWTLT